MRIRYPGEIYATGAKPARAIMISLLALSLIPVGGCADLSGSSVHGVVLDKVTGKPIPGAEVLVLWHGTYTLTFHGSGDGCYQVLNARTDEQGRFSVPAWHKDIPHVDADDYYLGAYKQGYGIAEGQVSGGIAGRVGRVPRDGVRVVLPLFAGTVRERLVVLRDLRLSLRCLEAGASRRNAVPFYAAMNDELKGLLVTDEGRAIRDREQAEREHDKKIGIDTLLRDDIAYDLDAYIERLTAAHDDELYEPVRRSAARTPEVKVVKQPTR